MAEEKPGLHIDLDWKKQAQEEKKRLEEEEKKRADERAAAATAPAAPAGMAPGEAAGGMSPQPTTQGRGRAAAGRTRGAGGVLPPASIGSLSQSLATQALYYLSDAAARTGDEAGNMDMAKHLIDTLQVLEQKTEGRLDPEEQQALDTALYEARTRFMSAAGQVIAGT
jgi:hypothetical protein